MINTQVLYLYFSCLTSCETLAMLFNLSEPDFLGLQGMYISCICWEKACEMLKAVPGP